MVIFAKSRTYMQKTYALRMLMQLTLLLIATAALAQQTATTAEGKKVILNADGTWKYVKESTASTSETDFRNVRWGMSKKQVKDLQKDKLVNEDAELVAYETTAIGLPAWMVFYFVDNKLYGSAYIFSPKAFGKDGSDYLNDFRSVNNLLEEKYGKATSEEEKWADDKEKYSDIAFHLDLGDVSFATTWKTERTIIGSSLGKQDGKIRHRVDYLSIELGNLARKKDKADF